MTVAGAAISLLICGLDLSSSSAQPAGTMRQEQSRASTTVSGQPAPEIPPTPYEPDLLQLADIMGSLAYLRSLCNGHDASLWRQKMLSLVETEGRTQAMRDRLIGAYNTGFKAYSSAHRTCLPATEEASVRLARDGEKLAKRLAGRYGG